LQGPVACSVHYPRRISSGGLPRDSQSTPPRSASGHSRRYCHARTTYIGRHRFNTKYWKTRERKPEAEVVEMAVPPIIDAAEFEVVQTLLKTRSLRSPRRASSAAQPSLPASAFVPPAEAR
jgi:hypothetical protein